MKRFPICLLFIFAFNLCAQSPFTFKRSYDIPVSDGTKDLAFPWLGGINSAQFSNIDFNQDGKLDLFMFDKTDNSISTFVLDENDELRLAPEYQSAFPELIEWALLRDYDNDGVLDILSGTVQDHIRVHKGSMSNGNFSFELITDAIIEQTTGEPLFVANADIPAVDDIDGDGVVDILTFDGPGTFVVLYSNVTTDPSNPQFTISDDCWGNFYEQGNSPELVLNNCTVGFANPDDAYEERSGVHPGSTLATTDLDGDGLKELLLGDIAFNKITMVNNDGSLEEANASMQDPNFPSGNVSVDIDIFPGIYFVDVNGDGQKEMLGSPNNPVSSESYECVWKYDSNISDGNQDFFLTQKNFMVDQTIDQSRMAYPAFIDYNLDGLTDLLIGNYGSRWFGNQQSVSSLSLYKNVGSATEPAFELVTNDYLGLSIEIGGLDLYPAVGNITGNGNDILLGTATPGTLNGTLILLPNTTPEGASEMTFGPPEYLFQGIDVVQNSSPQIVDVDRDGKDDLVIGQRNGLVHYYHQETNDAGETVFVEVDDDFNGWGDLSVVVTANQTATGHSSPALVDLNYDGVWELFVASETNGFLYLYDDIEANLSGGPFNLVTEHALGEDYQTGIRTSIAMTDKLIEDQWVLLLGNRKGGLQCLLLDDGVGISEQPAALNTFPNPTTGEVQVIAPIAFEQVRVWDLSGKMVLHLNPNAANSVDLSTLSNGVYMLEWIGEERFVSKVSLLK